MLICFESHHCHRLSSCHYHVSFPVHCYPSHSSQLAMQSQHQHALPFDLSLLDSDSDDAVVVLVGNEQFVEVSGQPPRRVQGQVINLLEEYIWLFIPHLDDSVIATVRDEDVFAQLNDPHRKIQLIDVRALSSPSCYRYQSALLHNVGRMSVEVGIKDFTQVSLADASTPVLEKVELITAFIYQQLPYLETLGGECVKRLRVSARADNRPVFECHCGTDSQFAGDQSEGVALGVETVERGGEVASEQAVLSLNDILRVEFEFEAFYFSEVESVILLGQFDVFKGQA